MTATKRRCGECGFGLTAAQVADEPTGCPRCYPKYPTHPFLATVPSLVVAHTVERAVWDWTEGRRVWNVGNVFRVEGDPAFYRITFETEGRQVFTSKNRNHYRQDPHVWRIEVAADVSVSIF
jgi:hypothetical protein